MKKFLITLAISAVVILGVWTIPNILNYNAKQYSELERQHIENIEEVERQNIEKAYEFMEEAIEDTTIYNDSLNYQYEQLQEEIVTATQPFDWQGLITWIIGSLNGVFGLIIMIKKVFGKSK